MRIQATFDCADPHAQAAFWAQVLGSVVEDHSGLVDQLVADGEEAVEEVGAVGLVTVGGVVALVLQGGSELDAGVEEGAGFADGFEGAVEFGWSGAVAVAEQSVVLAAQPCHPRPDRVGG
jgi:hypothetical protein